MDNLDNFRYIERLNIFLDLSKQAEREGFLALDDSRKLDPLPPVLRKGIRLICAGIDPDDVKISLSGYIDSCHFTQSERQEAILMMEGILLLQSGERGKGLLEKLKKVCGVEIYNKENMRIETNDERFSNFEHRKEEISSPVAQDESDFEVTFMAIQDSEEMERLLRITGYFDMGLALKSENFKAYDHVINHIDMRSKNELIKVMAAIGPCRMDDVIKSQQKVLNMRSISQLMSGNSLDMCDASEVLISYADAMKDILQTLSKVNEQDYRKLERFFCDGRSLGNMLLLFQTLVDNDIQNKTRIIPLIQKELQEGNCYNEDLWTLWHRYLQDALDVLAMWERDGTQERLNRILEVF